MINRTTIKTYSAAILKSLGSFFILLTIISITADRIPMETLGSLEPLNEHVSISKKENIPNLNAISVMHYEVPPLLFPIQTLVLKLTNTPYNIRQNNNSSLNLATHEDTNWIGRQQRIQSYHAAYIAAAKLAGVPVSYNLKLIFGANAKKDPRFKLQRGDQIIAIANQPIKNYSMAMSILRSLNQSEVPFDIIRDKKILKINISFQDILYTNNLIEVYEFENSIPITIKDDENSQEPSAGLITGLYFYYQMTEKTLPSEIIICGTGTINENGIVGEVGGVDLKTLAAHKANAKIMFVPKQVHFANLNELTAKETAKDLKSNLTIVPVATLKEATDYLEQINNKTKSTQ